MMHTVPYYPGASRSLSPSEKDVLGVFKWKSKTQNNTDDMIPLCLKGKEEDGR